MPLENNSHIRINTKRMRNILIPSPSCNRIAIDTPIVIAHLHISSALHSRLITSSHLAPITCPLIFVSLTPFSRISPPLPERFHVIVLSLTLDTYIH